MRTFLLFVGVFLAWDNFGQLIADDSLSVKKFYDPTLNGLRLRDPASIERIMGMTDNIVGGNNETEVINESRSQLLTMVFLPGDTVNQFSEFRVEYNSKWKLPKLKIDEREFVTGKGVRLGITEDQLLQALGEPKERKKEGYWMYYYKHQNRYYFGNYVFEDGRLVMFLFGEEYLK